MLLAISLLLAISSFAQKKEGERLQESYNVLKEILGTPDKGIPRDLLDKAECVVRLSVREKSWIYCGR